MDNKKMDTFGPEDYHKELAKMILPPDAIEWKGTIRPYEHEVKVVDGSLFTKTVYVSSEVEELDPLFVESRLKKTQTSIKHEIGFGAAALFWVREPEADGRVVRYTLVGVVK